MVLVLMFMGMMPLVMLWVMKEMSSESVDAPPWARKIVEVVAARDVELVDCTVAVGFVAVRELLRDERVASSLCQRANTATASAMTSAASTQARRLRTLERD